MKVRDLIRQLSRFDDGDDVRFSVDGYCPEGFPEWVDCRVRCEEAGEVEIVVSELAPDCQ